MGSDMVGREEERKRKQKQKQKGRHHCRPGRTRTGFYRELSAGVLRCVTCGAVPVTRRGPPQRLRSRRRKVLSKTPFSALHCGLTGHALGGT
jgi:hypothetical protein